MKYVTINMMQNSLNLPHIEIQNNSCKKYVELVNHAANMCISSSNTIRPLAGYGLPPPGGIL